MINGCIVEVACSGTVGEELFGQLASALEKLGYERKSLGANKLEMRFAGKWITTDPNKMRHSLAVTGATGMLAFKFSTGLIASSWSESDVAWAQARADEVVAAVV